MQLDAQLEMARADLERKAREVASTLHSDPAARQFAVPVIEEALASAFRSGEQFAVTYIRDRTLEAPRIGG